MQRAKAFLVVCAGAFLLAHAYHLGATSASAQMGGQISWAWVDETGQTVMTVVGRSLYATGPSGNFVHPYQIPGSADAVGCGPRFGAAGGIKVVLSNGDIYESAGDFRGFEPWTYTGNVLGGSTEATRESWGALKQRYR